LLAVPEAFVEKKYRVQHKQRRAEQTTGDHQDAHLFHRLGLEVPGRSADHADREEDEHKVGRHAQVLRIIRRTEDLVQVAVAETAVRWRGLAEQDVQLLHAAVKVLRREHEPHQGAEQ